MDLDNFNWSVFFISFLVFTPVFCGVYRLARRIIKWIKGEG